MNKEQTIDRFMRDQENKANSLYRKGYKDGYNEGFARGRTQAVVDFLSEDIEDEPIFKAGDVVEDTNGLEAVVTNFDTHVHLLYDNGKTWKVPKNLEHTLKKTGRTTKVIVEENLPW